MRGSVEFTSTADRLVENRNPALDLRVSECTNCLFEQPWWLDAVAPGAWNAVTVEKEGRVVGRLPYASRRRSGLVCAGNPPLTPTLGPWLHTNAEKYVTNISTEKDILTDLIQQLPACDLFLMTMPSDARNLLPFYWQGFERGSSVTYRLDLQQSLDTIWEGFNKSCRSGIRKAQKNLEVRTDLDIVTFCHVADMSFKRQQLASPLRHDLVARIDDAAERHNARRIFFAEDARGNIHAALYLVWDRRAAYYLMGGADPELRNSAAQRLLIWEAIQFATSVTSSFDFEGSSIQAIEHFIRSFGARQVTLPRVCRISRRMRALTGMKMVAEAISGRNLKWFF